MLAPERLGNAKDPDAFVREHGVRRFRTLVDESDCAVTWRALDFVRGITPDSGSRDRRAALARGGEWLGTLPPRYALEQEDALRHVADQCGYSRAAVERAFRARFWRDPSRGLQRDRRGLVMDR